MKNYFKRRVHLVPLHIENAPQDEFRARACDIPYLLYEVEQLINGDKIVINKPGGKRNFGRLAKDDYMVFILDSSQNLWLISHNELFEDIMDKKAYDPRETIKLINTLYLVCQGVPVQQAIARTGVAARIDDGLPTETILKVYKWIWGQEDCNYPKNEGRWLSMNALLEIINE